MTALEPAALTRENDYLKRRCAQLQGDVEDLNAQVTRLSQQLEQAHVRRTAARPPNPMSGGQ